MVREGYEYPPGAPLKKTPSHPVRWLADRDPKFTPCSSLPGVKVYPQIFQDVIATDWHSPGGGSHPSVCTHSYVLIFFRPQKSLGKKPGKTGKAV